MLNSMLSYDGIRAAVLGGSGFIGRWVAKLLSDQGADLWIVGRDRSRLNSVSEAYSTTGTKINLDLAKANAFKKLFEEIKPDVTFNLIGYGVSHQERDEKIAWRMNAEFVEELAFTIAAENKSRWKGMKLVHVGSGFEYGSVQGVITEETRPEPTTIYGRSKLAGTEKLQEISKSTGLPAVTARLFTVYGPGEIPQRLLPSLIRAAKSEEILKLTKGEQRRDFTYVKDVAFGLLKLGLLSEVRGNIVNLATGKLTSVRDFVELARSILAMESTRLLFGAIPYREDEIWQGNVNVDFLKHCIGWIPSYSIQDGIKESVEFEKSKETILNAD
jgi:UDP-glucose 4-epimerase